MLKKLLYLYNDGHNPFPKLGKGGLGYHLPQYRKRMHGGAFHRTVNENGDVLDEYDDGDMEDPHIYDVLFDEGFEEDVDEQEYYPEPVGRVEYDQDGYIIREGFYNDQNRIIFDDDEEKEKIRAKSRHKVTIDELNEDKWMEEIANKFDEALTNQYYFRKHYINDAQRDAVFEQVYKNLIADKINKKKFVTKHEIDKAMKELGFEYDIDIDKEQSSKIESEVKELFDSKVYDNRGQSFEDLMLTNYKDDLLSLTKKSGSPFRKPEENSLYYNDDGSPKKFKTRRMIQGILREEDVELYKNTLYDAGNKDTEIEFKYEPERSDLEIQVGKFTGNEFQIPYFHEVNGQWKLYNVWNKNIKSYVNKYEDKDLVVVVLLDDGKYKFSITNFIQSNPDIVLDQETRNGKKLYKINGQSLLKIFETSNRKGEDWIKIKKDILDKLT
jgi:hypothetical protein